MPRLNPRPRPSAEDAVARRITYERQRRGWSMAEVARRMADAGRPVNQTAIWKIENGTPRRTISLDETIALAEVFGFTVADLLTPPDDALAAEIERDIATARQMQARVREFIDEIRRDQRQLSDVGIVPRIMLGYAGLTEFPAAARDLLDELRETGDQLHEMADDLALAMGIEDDAADTEDG